jgi:hypothetical protein
MSNPPIQSSLEIGQTIAADTSAPAGNPLDESLLDDAYLNDLTCGEFACLLAVQAIAYFISLAVLAAPVIGTLALLQLAGCM